MCVFMSVFSSCNRLTEDDVKLKLYVFDYLVRKRVFSGSWIPRQAYILEAQEHVEHVEHVECHPQSGFHLGWENVCNSA